MLYRGHRSPLLFCTPFLFSSSYYFSLPHFYVDARSAREAHYYIAQSNTGKIVVSFIHVTPESLEHLAILTFKPTVSVWPLQLTQSKTGYLVDFVEHLKYGELYYHARPLHDRPLLYRRDSRLAGLMYMGDMRNHRLLFRLSPQQGRQHGVHCAVRYIHVRLPRPRHS